MHLDVAQRRRRAGDRSRGDRLRRASIGATVDALDRRRRDAGFTGRAPTLVLVPARRPMVAASSGVSGGVSSHASLAWRTRSAARTSSPDGEPMQVGRLARDALEHARRDPSTRGTQRSRPSVYGWRGSANSSSRGATSTIRPPYITATRSHMPATMPEVVGDEDRGRVHLAAERRDQLQDLRLDGGVEGGRRLVGDQQRRAAGDGERDHHALAHAARELVGVGVEPAAPAPGCRPASSSSMARVAGGPAAHAEVDAEQLGQVLAGGHQRVQRRGRVLRDEPDLPAADASPSAVADRPSRSSPWKTIWPLVICAGAGQHPQDGHRRRGLARSALADERERLALAQREGHVADGADLAASGEERGVEVADLQDRPRGSGRRVVGAGSRPWLCGRLPRSGKRRGPRSTEAPSPAGSRGRSRSGLPHRHDVLCPGTACCRRRVTRAFAGPLGAGVAGRVGLLPGSPFRYGLCSWPTSGW